MRDDPFAVDLQQQNRLQAASVFTSGKTIHLIRI